MVTPVSPGARQEGLAMVGVANGWFLLSVVTPPRHAVPCHAMGDTAGDTWQQAGDRVSPPPQPTQQSPCSPSAPNTPPALAPLPPNCTPGQSGDPPTRGLRWHLPARGSRGRGFSGSQAGQQVGTGGGWRPARGGLAVPWIQTPQGLRCCRAGAPAGTVWHGSAWHSTARLGMAQNGVIWHSTAWFCTAQHSTSRHPQTPAPPVPPARETQS